MRRSHLVSFEKSKYLTTTFCIPWESGVGKPMKSISGSGRETFGMLVKEFYVKSTFGRRTTNDMKLRTRIIDDSIKLRLSKSLNLQKASFFLSFFNREKSIKQSKLVPWMTTQRFSSNDFFFVFSDSIPDNEMIEDFTSTDPNCKQLSHVQGGAFPFGICDSAFVQDGVDSCNCDPHGLTPDDHRLWIRSAVIVERPRTAVRVCGLGRRGSAVTSSAKDVTRGSQTSTTRGTRS